MIRSLSSCAFVPLFRIVRFSFIDVLCLPRARVFRSVMGRRFGCVRGEREKKRMLWDVFCYFSPCFRSISRLVLLFFGVVLVSGQNAPGSAPIPLMFSAMTMCLGAVFALVALTMLCRSSGPIVSIRRRLRCRSTICRAVGMPAVHFMHSR